MANRTDLSARVLGGADIHQRRGRAGRVRVGTIVAVAGVVALAIALLGAVESRASTQRLATDWRMDETDHFSVFFASSISSEIDQVKREVERAYNVVSAERRHDVPFQPVLVVFSTGAEMERGSSATSLAATLGALPPPEKRVLIAIDMTSATRNSELVRQIRAIFDRDIAVSKPRAQANSTSAPVGELRRSRSRRSKRTSRATCERLRHCRATGVLLRGHQCPARRAYRPRLSAAAAVRNSGCARLGPVGAVRHRREGGREPGAGANLADAAVAPGRALQACGAPRSPATPRLRARGDEGWTNGAPASPARR